TAPERRPKAVSIVKINIYYGNLEKTFAVYQRNACKSITDERGRAGSGEKTYAKTRSSVSLNLRVFAHPCHITNIEPLAPGLTLILRFLAGYSCNAQ
ncbi:hypothetical protein, partial [Candidatus Albibeggiatoa sp. nov. NOAA]|uniref:hypothetical protein n=1 Tax=Candidatus Albibeggiatoa sp. nov. NOAA TaxID=3162724 RepID=UPI0032F9F2A7|nr:hypothetical protein [Thiotrichaceae bacterium]